MLFSSAPREAVSRRTRLAASFGALGYAPELLEALPEGLLRHAHPSGCPIASVKPRRGETVVDIGSGHGFDCLLLEAAAPSGVTVIGVDRWSEPFGSVPFVTADGASLPLAAGTADWVTLNGVLCVVPEPERVLDEAFRVLRPGGRLSLGLLLHSLPPPLGWAARRLAGIRGGRSEEGYRAMLRRQGFLRVRVEARHRYTLEQAADLWGTGAGTRRLLRWGRAGWARPVSKRVIERFHGIDVSAVKPAGAPPLRS